MRVAAVDVGAVDDADVAAAATDDTPPTLLAERPRSSL